MALTDNFWQLFVISAPWLLLGLFIAGLIKVYLPKNFLIKHLGKEGFVSTVKAALIGAPMPLCSCGVIPAALGLRRAGASKSATTAFLVSTPETGVDSISVSYVLLGPFMAVIRPIAAITSAIVAGLLVGRDKGATSEESAHKHDAKETCCSKKEPKVEISCCSKKEPESKPAEVACCSENKHQTPHSHTDTIGEPSSRIFEALHFSCTKLLQDTAKWLLIGLFFAALIQTFVPNDFFTQWGTGILAMVVVVLISIPMYICATASTPIAAGLLLSGVSPGAVLVFMLAGPATNIATLGVVINELGKRAVAAYLTGVIGIAIIFGLLTDFLVETYGIEVAPMLGEENHVLPHWLMQAFAILLIALLIRLVVLRFKK
ncbi:SO_0444 family Cu/Zn efflux transporter [Pseudoalteromonas sp. C2R02]|uniref:SO_0444 family Cu/Zn efflux transporter n=1 Tax=Pseudoalteromonas sp. C2R02 TaxID=2841565 RepID=UPI001C080021|nr:SO_0444 family Cu/Zn efflux transporter [Pseudoalteromonas sp. C2R02]